VKKFNALLKKRTHPSPLKGGRIRILYPSGNGHWESSLKESLKMGAKEAVGFADAIIERGEISGFISQKKRRRDVRKGP